MPTLKKSGNCVFLLDTIGPDSVNAPVIVLGRVVPTNTAGREATQDPMTGFACSDTPLGRGHIVGLFLGGPDIPENYAPQYEQWQQGGAWKQMEAAMAALAATIPSTDALYMAVRVTYDRVGNTYLTEKADFASGKILDWTDARIPNRFEVWSFRASDARSATFLAALGGAGAAGAMAGLPGSAFLVAVADFDCNVMPQIDYDFWLRNLIRRWARDSAVKAKRDFDTGVATETASRLAARSTGGGGGGKAPSSRKPAARPSPMAAARLSRSESAQLESDLRQHYGFNAALSTDAWMLDNVDKVVVFIRSRIQGATWGVRAADLLVLNGNDDVAGLFVTTKLV